MLLDLAKYIDRENQLLLINVKSFLNPIFTIIFFFNSSILEILHFKFFIFDFIYRFK